MTSGEAGCAFTRPEAGCAWSMEELVGLELGRWAVGTGLREVRIGMEGEADGRFSIVESDTQWLWR